MNDFFQWALLCTGERKMASSRRSLFCNKATSGNRAALIETVMDGACKFSNSSPVIGADEYKEAQ